MTCVFVFYVLLKCVFNVYLYCCMNVYVYSYCVNECKNTSFYFAKVEQHNFHLLLNIYAKLYPFELALIFPVEYSNNNLDLFTYIL